jgi:hypothetical protein
MMFVTIQSTTHSDILTTRGRDTCNTRLMLILSQP